MSEKSDLLASIALTIKDYRAGEINEPTPEHVNRWIEQFDEDVRVPLLRELDHVFKRTYLSKKSVSAFLNNLVKNESLAGKDPCAYWEKTNFLQIQQNGYSQREMLKLFDNSLQEQCGIRIDSCGLPGGDYVYIDDVMFSGNRVGNDLSIWIEKYAPNNAKVHVIVAIFHTSGQYLVDKRLKQVVEASRKNIEIKYWRSKEVENRKFHKDTSEVLWPTVVSDDEIVTKYLAQPQRFPFEPRIPDGKLGPFSSEEGRQLLEREMLMAGLKIRGLVQSPKDILRPLGYSPFGLGFGTMYVTYRNCPNNCPLALWWGSPEATEGAFNWYPLFRRKTYVQTQADQNENRVWWDSLDEWWKFVLLAQVGPPRGLLIDEQIDAVLKLEDVNLGDGDYWLSGHEPINMLQNLKKLDILIYDIDISQLRLPALQELKYMPENIHVTPERLINFQRIHPKVKIANSFDGI